MYTQYDYMLRNRFVVLSHHKHVYKPFDFVTCTIPTLSFPLVATCTNCAFILVLYVFSV